ncbi:MAG: hypothetical protein HYX39_00875 [Bacteroidetes bacterium]|nr:hypothetical protein [Bacteroidota bacterium]
MSKQQDSFNALQKLLPDFSEEGTVQKLNALNQCALLEPRNPKLIKQYHNALLFLISYAENESVFLLAQKEIERIESFVSTKPQLKEVLSGSGVTATATVGAYSLTLIKCLLKKFPHAISIHSFHDKAAHPKEVLKFILPEAEFEILNDEKLSPLNWLKKASGFNDKAKILNWLINTFEFFNADVLIKDHLFESLKIYVQIKTLNHTFSKSFGYLKIDQRYYHSPSLLKKFDEVELINRKLPAETKLSAVQKNNIITAARVALCLLNRETDPITYCEEQNLKYYTLERGLSIALFSIDSERRLPLESYIGFMMFKNGYPMAYGGAWLFGKRSLIGINIFESFRGGESAFVFAQLLRCYRMAFGAAYFEVEPYQFGKNNPEGIQSGAFWFYYRFGFKPCNKNLYELALKEHLKITNTKGYRSPPAVLKQFTGANMFVHFDSTPVVPPDPTAISKYLTRIITIQFKGNRNKALKHSIKQLKQEGIITGSESKIGLSKLVLFFGLCIDHKTLSFSEKRLIGKIIEAKESDEFEYIKLLNNFPVQKFNIDSATINI